MAIECSCAYEGWDDGPDVYGCKTRTARKSHRCCECGENIAPGEQYEDAGGLWYGAWATYRTCHLCVRIRDGFGIEAHTAMRDHLMGCLGFDYVTGEYASWAKKADEVCDD